jgi:hypothetical protein
MKRWVPYGLVVGLLVLGLSAPAAPSTDRAKAKEALKELHDFIGSWEGTGGPDKPKPGPRDPFWTETIGWSWRFKGDDAWMVLDVKGGKFLKGGEVRYLPAKKAYQLTATTADGKKLVFEGKLKDQVLTFERQDPATKDVQQFKINSAADGDRLIYRVWSRADGGTVWRKDYLVAATRKGVSLAIREKKPECVVSGGLGTSTVSYMSETYYVCCSGCADAFRENPKKYVDEYKAKKGKK